jgi:glycine cleavage system aminomethyltransferase T
MSGFADAQREGWQKTVDLKDRPFVLERPAVFSPAGAAQEAGNGSGAWWRWTPLFLPTEYTHWLEESTAHVDSVYIGDWSALSKFRVKGPDALAFLQWVGMNDLSGLTVGQVRHSVQCTQEGLLASEGIVMRTGEDEYVYTGGGGDWTHFMFGQGKWNATAEMLDAEYFIFEVQGPKSIFVIEKVAGEDLRNLQFNDSRPAKIGDAPVRVLRTGISGELGYELHGHADDANDVWRAVVEAGAEFGIKQLGVRSQLVQHVEFGFATNGLDYLPASIVTPGAPRLIPQSTPRGSYIPYQGVPEFFRSPLELGWGWDVDLDSHDFVGREALKAQMAEGGPARRLVGLEWNTEDVMAVFASLFGDGPIVHPMELPRYLGFEFDEVRVDGQRVGCSTSRTYSPTLRKMISLAVVARELAEPGTEVMVLWGPPGPVQKEMRCTVRELPFKEDRRRTDVTQVGSAEDARVPDPAQGQPIS